MTAIFDCTEFYTVRGTVVFVWFFSMAGVANVPVCLSSYLSVFPTKA